jgi:hypothetical protein
VELLPAAVL